MGRKNDRVRRKNGKGRLHSRYEGDLGYIPVEKVIYRPRVEDIVMPDGRCDFQGRPKVTFMTEEKAAKALAQAQRTREATHSINVEKRYYPCPEGGCGGFHLTSLAQPPRFRQEAQNG